MSNYKFLPYDKNLVSRARELRKNETEAEKKFWTVILKEKSLDGFKFTRQKPLGNFIEDFYCAKYRLAIEIDGGVHTYTTTRDAERDNILSQKFGVTVLRFKNEDILNNKEKILNNLLKVISRISP